MKWDAGNVVFIFGSTIAAEGDTIYPCYSAADARIALITGNVTTLLDWLTRHGEGDK